MFFVALFVTMSFSLTSCGDDDDNPGQPGSSSKFLLNKTELYLHSGMSLTHDDSQANATLSDTDLLGNPNIEREMQIVFQLFTSPDEFDAMFPVAEIGIMVEPFDVTTTSKGTKLKIVEKRRYTYVVWNKEGNYFGYDTANNVRYSLEKSGSVTFEGYDSSTNIATISISATATSDDSETVKLQGTVLCDYDNHGLTSYN